MREATLYSLLSQLAGGQVYPYVVPLTEGKPAVSPPWLVFSVVSDTASDVLDGQAESRITVQIDVWATVPDDADNIREQALDAVRKLAPSVDAPRDKCTLSCAINGIHAAFHYLKKNYISGCVMTVPTG
ncbi:TPA: DUF3168 domain-containing protein [Escherichia coli]|nr:DUF3168 domain-containing protein [Escherichia coli]